ncbi:HAD family hydrolase [Glycomyces terrestris]|uniref:HAD-IB family hydrolase n=1 Tax=Glycomyces terrestris TaxID=2493553 RepID=A0A426UY80_9ACTN|nr:HAD-IB family hydrolase [Glycomyces terrestris]RRR99518.1 HAD-IB family hydrolase [Glycomyces terrestris]
MSEHEGVDAAFFDVDETLISVKSMFRFLEFYLDSRGEPAGAYRVIRDRLGDLAASGVPREEVNRAYYRCYAGESAERLAAAGHAWLKAELAEPGFLVDGVVAEHEELRRAGVPTVLVSGSFYACLDPIGALLGASEVHGAPVIVRRGRLTGEIDHPVIGEGKAHVVRAVTRLRGLDPARCVAYGDHASDLPMLDAVGTAVVVGADPELRRRADHRGWRVLDPAAAAA